MFTLTYCEIMGEYLLAGPDGSERLYTPEQMARFHGIPSHYLSDFMALARRHAGRPVELG